MSAVAKVKLTESEYLAKEEVSEFRSEFYRGEMFAMVGGTPAHNQIKENLVVQIGGKLWGGKCRTRSSDQRVKVESTGLYTYPDIVIFCEEGQYAKSDPNSLTNPQVIIEILSPSTESYDRIEKFGHYQKIETLQEYVLVAQSRVAIERFVKNSQGDWVIAQFAGNHQEFEFATIPVRLNIADIYAGVELPQAMDKPRTDFGEASG
jgi:Uma2 family endonuclease